MSYLNETSPILEVTSKMDKSLDINKRFLLLPKTIELMEKLKEHSDFKYGVSVFANNLQAMIRNYPSMVEIYQNEIWQGVEFVFSHPKNLNYLKSVSFLCDLKLNLSEENIEILKNRYKVNFNTREIKESLLLTEYNKNYAPKVNYLKFTDIDDLVDSLDSYIRSNKIDIYTVEKLYEKYPDLLLLNIKSFYSMKVTDNDLRKTLDHTLETPNTMENKIVLMGNFAQLVAETNTFKNSLELLNKQKPALLKFFNKEMKSKKSNRNVDYKAKNLAFKYKEVVEALVTNPTLVYPNLEHKVQRKQKLEIFGKMNLNDKERAEYQEFLSQKNTNSTKKKKI